MGCITDSTNYKSTACGANNTSTTVTDANKQQVIYRCANNQSILRIGYDLGLSPKKRGWVEDQLKT